MKKDMLSRFDAMKQDARERGIKVSRDQLAVLVLADVVEDAGIATERQLEEIDKSLVNISQNLP